jgi:hypothetical protein
MIDAEGGCRDPVDVRCLAGDGIPLSGRRGAQRGAGQRGRCGGGAFGGWEQAGMALETHALLSQQSQRREIEYRIIGVNSAGISVPSNTAAVVLLRGIET